MFDKTFINKHLGLIKVLDNIALKVYHVQT
jgi:hypothetical protein